ncbi:hypothetical protein GCM10027299_56860 [Larkinella ripae]
MNPNLLPIAFQLQFSEPIWRLVFEQVDTAPAVFVAELRSREKQRLSLVTVHLPDGTIRSETHPRLPFHSSLAGVWNGNALYHRFDNSRLPVPTALGRVDLKTGQSVWEWPQHALTTADAEHVWAQRTSLADAVSAPPVSFRLTDGEPVQGPEKPPSVHNSRLRFPISYTNASSWWPVVDRFLKKIIPDQAIDSVDYLEVADKLIFSYYYRETNNQLRASLLITDRLQTIWFHQHSGQGSETNWPLSESNARSLFGNGSFCVWQNQLIIQSSATCIISYYLTPMP